MDNSKMNQQRRGSLTPSSMSRTLWSSESPTRDSRSSDDHKGVNIKVVLRCRPLNEEEMKEKKPPVISCDGIKQVTVMNNKLTDRTFVFDKVFGPTSQQKEVYEDVVAPVVNDVLDGYSWTVLAYGQSGTGKTYTMEGDTRKDKNGQFHNEAGVISRALEQIFDILENKNANYSMKVTYLELYNEEITDLLASDDKPKRSLVLMEDGKGAVFVRGLEEETVCTADQAHTILEKGSEKKHMAYTLVNKQSNRSHSIFSITVQVTESIYPDGSEVVKCGKLNLVDLAGSENILRSGAREVRAREAGEINKSLLTLGRVINVLAENSGHVPYRDSKLTRLLRDSLGGKTKTCMIATISPSVLCLEETMSTLDYAFRAKSIKNTPQVNQKLNFEPGRIKQELHETTDGDNVPHGLLQSEEATNKQLMELQQLYLYQQQLTIDLEDKLESTQRELVMTQESLSNMEDKYQCAKDANKEKDDTIFNLLCSGKELTERALELQSDLDNAASDVSNLFSRIEQKRYLEDRKRHHIKNVYSRLAQQLEELDKFVSIAVTQQEHFFKLIQDDMQSFLTSKSEAIDEVLNQIELLKDSYGSGIKHLEESAQKLYQNSQLALRRLNLELSDHSSCIMNLRSSASAVIVNNGLKSKLNHLGSIITAFLQQHEENHIRTYLTSKSVSQSLLKFSKNLSVYISKLRLMEEDSQSITNHKLSAFRNKFEEFALEEEKILLEKMAQLLSSSTSRKNNLIQAAIDDIQENASERTKKLNDEFSNMRNFNADAEQTLTNYIERTESNYAEDTAAIESAKGTLGDSLCYDQPCRSKHR